MKTIDGFQNRHVDHQRYSIQHQHRSYGRSTICMAVGLVSLFRRFRVLIVQTPTISFISN